MVCFPNIETYNKLKKCCGGEFLNMKCCGGESTDNSTNVVVVNLAKMVHLIVDIYRYAMVVKVLILLHV